MTEEQETGAVPWLWGSAPFALGTAGELSEVGSSEDDWQCLPVSQGGGWAGGLELFIH